MCECVTIQKIVFLHPLHIFNNIYCFRHINSFRIHLYYNCCKWVLLPGGCFFAHGIFICGFCWIWLNLSIVAFTYMFGFCGCCCCVAVFLFVLIWIFTLQIVFLVGCICVNVCLSNVCCPHSPHVFKGGLRFGHKIQFNLWNLLRYIYYYYVALV